MRPSDVERWAITVLDLIERHSPFESAVVELKSAWPEPRKAARRIAGHANSARGNDILWLIGVDEKTKVVVGASPINTAAWLAQVGGEFDHSVPEMTDVLVEWNRLPVSALAFSTERPPYVVKNPSYGKESGEGVRFEVPWREGTAIKSASRTQLLRLLAPIIALPEIELVDATLVIDDTNESGQSLLSWLLSMTIYVTPRTQHRIALAAHRIQPSHRVNGQAETVYYGANISFHPMGSYAGSLMPFTQAPRLHPTIQSTNYDATVDGPGLIQVIARTPVNPVNLNLIESDRRCMLKIRPTGNDFHIDVEAVLKFLPTDSQSKRWALK